MQTQDLFKLLTILKEVSSRKWRHIPLIVQAINNDATVLFKEWVDKFEQDNYPLDLCKLSTWGTFDECVTIKFSMDKDNLICKAEIYEGDFRGCRTNLRFKATILLPDNFICLIENEISWAFDSFAEEGYENHLENKKREWIKSFKYKILQ